MSARIRVPSLLLSVVLPLAWASNALAQTAPPPSSWGAQPTPKAPSAQPAAPAPTVTPAAPAPSAPATAAFPTTAPHDAAAAPATPPSFAPPPAAAPITRQARVRFNANEPGAVLESDATPDGRSAGWYVVCEAPCTGTVSKEGSFRVGGAGYHASRVFRLPEERNEFKVDAEMESSSVAVPMAITIVGGVIASAGGMMLLGGLVAEENHRDGEELILPGAIIGGAGAVIATIGVLMLVIDAQHDESKAHVAKAARGITF